MPSASRTCPSGTVTPGPGPSSPNGSWTRAPASGLAAAATVFVQHVSAMSAADRLRYIFGYLNDILNASPVPSAPPPTPTFEFSDSDDDA